MISKRSTIPKRHKKVRTDNQKALDVDVEFAKAIKWHREGRLQKAKEIYKNILEWHPGHADTLHLLGFVEHQTDNGSVAVGLISKAIEIQPKSPLYHHNLGLVYSALGQNEKAIASYQKALAIYPDYHEAYYNIGTVYQNQNQLDQAVDCYQKALAIQPELPEALASMGHALQDQGKFADAALSYQEALELCPQDTDLRHRLGRVMEDLGQLEEALVWYRRILEIQPQHAEAYNDMGVVFRQQGQYAEAMSCFLKAIGIEPSSAEAHNNRGNLLQDSGNLEAAAESYRKALAIRPDFVQACNNLGMAYQGMGQSEKAIACFQKAIKILPDGALAHRHLVHQLQKDCAWEQMEAPAAQLDELSKLSLDTGTRPAEDPFLNLTRHAHPAYNFAIARAWSADLSRRLANVNRQFSFDQSSRRSKPITIGYLSNNFHDHPMAHLLLGLFSLHNRNKFKINCYSCGKADDSYYRRRISQDCDKFVDLRDLSHLEAAKAIYNDGVDILVDLMGQTKGSRMEICALRPAPIQVRYLGLAGTTGADFFDYLITDKIVTPETDGPYYSEKFAYLPHCYQVNNYGRAADGPDSAEDEPGPKLRSFVFCSFSQDYKIEPVMFDSWTRILRRTPGSILWLMIRHSSAREQLRSEAYKRGVNPDRLIFLERQPKKQHLARLKMADLALDTRVVNGAATTSDALWAGVPVITLKGTHFASRMSSSILSAIGLPDLIARSIEEYEAHAIHLASNPDCLGEVRDRLKKNLLSEPLFDSSRFVENLERAYDQMWQIFKAGFKPRQIEVIEPNSNDTENLDHTFRAAKPIKHKSLNILFVQEFPCIRNYKMAKALTSRNVNVSLAYSKARLSQVYTDLSDDVYRECIKIKSHRQLWDISRNYDIVHCHNEPDLFTVAALAGDAPVVHDTHDLIYLRSNDDQNLFYFEGLANRGAHGRIYSTSYQMEEAKRLYGIEGPSIVLNNYTSSEDLPTRKLAKRSKTDGQIHIVYEGGIGGSAHRDFSAIFHTIAKFGIHVHIYPTTYNAKLAVFFSKYPTIHYYRPVSPKQIIQEMTQYDFGIIPFNLEKGNRRFLDSTIANKLFEYLAAGLPVITSPLKSYVKFFKENPVGITIEKPQEIVNNLDRLKHISSNTDYAKYIFTYEKEIDRVIGLYQDVIYQKKRFIRIR